MRKEEVDILVKEYRNFLVQEITTRQEGDFVAISTPFLDRKNDYIKVYVSHSPNNPAMLLITDDGNTISDLEISGCEINTSKRREILGQILNGHGISFDEKTKALSVLTTVQDFPIKKHLFLQGILAVNDMYNLSSQYIVSIFKEDVENWFDRNNVMYVSNVQINGKGFPHTMDFMFPKTQTRKERALKLVNNPTTDHIKNMIFTYLDASEIFLSKDFYVLINDENKNSTNKALEILSKYNNAINPLLWSERENNISQFRA
jgi:hypothetical protein